MGWHGEKFSFPWEVEQQCKTTVCLSPINNVLSVTYITSYQLDALFVSFLIVFVSFMLFGSFRCIICQRWWLKKKKYTTCSTKLWLYVSAQDTINVFSCRRFLSCVWKFSMVFLTSIHMGHFYMLFLLKDPTICSVILQSSKIISSMYKYISYYIKLS